MLGTIDSFVHKLNGTGGQDSHSFVSKLHPQCYRSNTLAYSSRADRSTAVPGGSPSAVETQHVKYS